MDYNEIHKVVLTNIQNCLDTTKAYTTIEELLENVEAFMPCPSEFGYDDRDDICGYYHGCCKRCWEMALQTK